MITLGQASISIVAGFQQQLYRGWRRRWRRPARAGQGRALREGVARLPSFFLVVLIRRCSRLVLLPVFSGLVGEGRRHSEHHHRRRRCGRSSSSIGSSSIIADQSL